MTAKCQFWINSGPFGKPCGKPATIMSRFIINKDLPHKFSPPPDFYCDKHWDKVSDWKINKGEFTYENTKL